MAIADDFTINYSLKTVTHTSGTTIYTVLAFFQWLAATFADTAQMDDSYAFVADTPTVYHWTNGWDMGDETSYQFLRGGSIETSDGLRLFSNLYTIGTQYRNSQIYLIQNDTEITPWWSTGNIDILIKVKNAGTLIDAGNVLVMSRDTDCLYDHNFVDLSGGGRNPVGINTAQDNNYLLTGDIYLSVNTVSGFDAGNYAYGTTSTATGRIQYVDTTNTRLYLVQVEGTFAGSETLNERTSRTAGDTGTTATSSGPTNVIAGYSDITITFADQSYDLGNGNGPQPYKATINCALRSVLQIYQYLKYVARHNSTTTVNSDSGEEYRSALEGTYTDVKTAPFGTYAGGKFFGARGIYITNMIGSDSNNYSLIDSNGATQNPPATIGITVNGVESDDKVVVFRATDNSGTIDRTYLTSHTSDNTLGSTTFRVNETIPDDTPTTNGVIRIDDTTNNSEQRYSYTSWTNTPNPVFSGIVKLFGDLSTGLDRAYDSQDYAYVPYIDSTATGTSISVSVQYEADRNITTRVRKKGIQPFTVNNIPLNSSGYTATAIRTIDTIVT